MLRSLTAAILGLLLVQEGGDAAAEKSKLDEELAKAAEPVAEQLLKWKSWDEARAFLEVIRAKSDARAESLDKLIAKTDKQTSGWEWDRRTCELIKQFGKERAKKFYAFARAWKEKDAKVAKWTDTEGEILDDIISYSRSYGLLFQLRTNCGLPRASFDWGISIPAVWHAKYLILNPDDDVEIDGKPGFSEEGKKSSKSSITNSSDELARVIERMVHSPIRRHYLSHPGLTRVGLGQAKTVRTASVVDVLSGIDLSRDQQLAVAIPHDNAKDVPTLGEDLGDLIPSKASEKPGYPISLIFFDPEIKISDVRARLTEGANREIEVYLSTPENPANPDKYPNNRNSIIMIPKVVLKLGTQYSVKVSYSVKGQATTKSWVFKTKAQN